MLGLERRNIEQALETVHLTAHKDKLVKNYSLGMKQRLGIAMALARNPKLLILDEPLANLDPFLEAEISANMARLRSDRTTVVIAHRLTSIRMAERIIVLNDGRIEASGNHDELLGKPFYRNLLGTQIGDET